MVFSVIQTVCVAALLTACVAMASADTMSTPVANESVVLVDVETRAGSSDPLCSLPTLSFVAAAKQYPTLTTALNEMLKNSIALWYTDNQTPEGLRANVDRMFAYCGPDTRVMLVVYGLPNKDCEAGYSSSGLNKNANDYRNWIQTLANTVGQRKVLYVLEPDAVGLVANGGCAVQNGYTANVRTALQILSQNANADIYMDVGFWTLEDSAGASRMANTVKTLASAGRLKGIVLNTSNYRPTSAMAQLCTNFQNAYGSRTLNCVVDTSRNYNNSPPDREWCNARFGGVGRPPTSSTGFGNIDYLIWIKPAGESDGACDGAGHTSNAMRGPASGTFFKEHFVELWNNGYFVKERGFHTVSA